MTDEEYQVIISIQNHKIRDIIIWANDDSITQEIESYIKCDKFLTQNRDKIDISYKKKGDE